MNITINIVEPIKKVQEFKEYDLGQITTTLQDLLDNSSIIVDSNIIPILKILSIDNIYSNYLIKDISENSYNTGEYITGQDLTEGDLILIVSEDQINQLNQLNQDLVLTKLDTGGFVGTAQDLDDDIQTRVEKVTGKSLVSDTEITKLSHLDDTTDLQKPVSTAQQAAIDAAVQAQLVDSTLINEVTEASAVPPTGNIHAIGIGPGTYPYWGGMVIPENNIRTLQRVEGVYSVSLTEIILDDYATKKEVYAIKTFDKAVDNVGVDKTYIDGQVDALDLNFSLKGIITKKNMRFDSLDDNFNDGSGNSEIYNVVLQNSASFEAGSGVYKITSTVNETNTAVINRQRIQLPFFANKNTQSLQVEISDISEIASKPTIGVYSNMLQSLSFVYDKEYAYDAYTDENGSHPPGVGCILMEYWTPDWNGHFVDPVDTFNKANRSRFKSFTGKFTLMLEINNNIAYINAEQNGIYHQLAVFDLTSYISYSGFDVMTPFTFSHKWFFGCDFVGGSLTTDSAVSFSNVKLGFSSGMSMGSDYKIVKSITGEPIVQDNYIYITATSHSSEELSGLGGINIYKLNLDTNKIEFTGKVISALAGKNNADASATILYDREHQVFIYSASKFVGDPYPVIGESKDDLLNGYSTVGVSRLILPASYPQTWIWDFDFYFDKTRNVWCGILKEGDYFEATSLYIEWTLIHNINGYEGATFFKINNKINYTVALGETDGNLKVRNISGTDLGHLKFDVYPKKSANAIGTLTPSWGSVIPVTRNNKTFYYAILFGMRFFEGNQFGYGDMWVYKSLEQNSGWEF